MFGTMNVETVHDSDIPRVNVTQVCSFCEQPSHVNGVRAEGFAAWQYGTKIQHALPELSDGDRETLVSGCHESCFDEAFADEDE